MITAIKELITKHKKIIIDGMIRPRDIGPIGIDLVIYIEPKNWKKYPKAIKERYEKDIANGTKTLGVLWRVIGDSDISKKELDKIISEVADKQQKYSEKLKDQYRGLLYKNAL